MQKDYLETSKEAEIMSQELEYLIVAELEVADAIKISNQALNAATDQIRQSEKMMARAEVLFSKIEPCTKLKLPGWKR